MAKHTRVFNGHKYELRNAYYGQRAAKQLEKDIQWTKQHGISYRTTKVTKPAKGVLLWYSSP